MGTGQMMLVLFAMILFSSIMIGTMNNMYDLSEMSYDTMIQMQGQRLIDRYYQEIDSGILAGTLKFNDIKNYNGFKEEFNINGNTYNVKIETHYASIAGYNMSTETDYQRVDIVVWCKGVKRDVIWIGTADNPISRMYARMGF